MAKTRLSLGEAEARLREGGVVAIPTETVYGLAASALSHTAVARIFAVKGRPTHHPLIVHLASFDLVPGWAETTPEAAVLAERFWPGPLTMILRRGPLALDTVTGGLETVGVRVPAHPLTLELLTRLGTGVAAPSANRFGRVSPTRAEHVLDDLGDEVDGVLDGGPAAVGLESTIVDLTGDAPALLRLGAITPDAIAEVLGRPVLQHLHAARAKAPGQLASHYAPRAQLEVVAHDALAERRRALEARGARVAVLGDVLGDTAESWARGLYAALREVDSKGPDVILVRTPPAGALHAALSDRLARAAAPRG
jgi:L-threonylcarbamoyladenylate synthase